jgi:stage II sporulation protein D
MFVRCALAAVLGVALLAGAASARPDKQSAVSPPPASVTFVLSGHGWGHGVGLGQYGAYGFAKHGWTYDRILAHYYRGTKLGAAPVSKVRVLLGEQRAQAAVSSAAPFRIRDATGVVRSFSAGPVVVSATGVNLTLPATALPGKTPLELDGKPYRGTLEFTLAGKRLNVVNVVGIDQYLYGVVTSEMDSDWPAEALKSQAVAARSYALYNRQTGSFDLYADTRSQAYGGVAAETESARAAVDATARLVLFYDGKVADTFFSASSGGRTADATEVWSEKPIPYLVSVSDPYDTLSPYHDWGPVVLTAEEAGKTLRVTGLQDLVADDSGPSGHARTVTAVGALGDVEMDGSAFRRAFDLRSTWVSIGKLSLDRPRTPLPYEARTKLTGSVRGLKGTVLEQRIPGSVWRSTPAFASSTGGSFAAVIAPRETIELRLRYGTVTTQVVRVVVVPSVTAGAAADGTGIAGRVRPLVAGGEVEAQQLRGKTWTTLDSTTPDSAGRYALQLSPGNYRIRYAPGGNLGDGYSGVVRVG